MSEIAVIAQRPGHQPVEHPGDRARSEGCTWATGEAVARKRWDDDVKSVGDITAELFRMSQPIDQARVERVGPAVHDQQRARGRSGTPLVHEVDLVFAMLATNCGAAFMARSCTRQS
jgi:hypothetical protein